MPRLWQACLDNDSLRSMWQRRKGHLIANRRQALIAVAIAIGLVMGVPAQAEAPKPRFKHTHGHLNAKDYAFVLVADKWQSRAEYACLLRLWGKESAWNHRADNPTSSAFGIAQLLREKAKSPHRQIDNGLKYIISRYETPCNAWRFWLKQKAKKGTGWY